MGPSPLSILSSPHSLSLLLPGLCPPMPLSHNYTKSHSHIFSILHTLCIFTICHHPTSSPTLYPHSLSATLYPTPSYTYPYSPLSFYLAPYPVDHSIPLPRLHVTSSHMTHRVQNTQYRIRQKIQEFHMRYNNPDLYLSHMICKSLLGTGFVTIGTFLSKSYGPFPDIFIIVFYSNYYKINLLYLGFSQTFQNFPSLSILSKTSNISSGNFICNLDYALSLTEAYLLWSPFFVPQSYSMHNRSLRTPYKPFHYFHDLKRLSLNSMTICIQGMISIRFIYNVFFYILSKIYFCTSYKIPIQGHSNNTWLQFV